MPALVGRISFTGDLGYEIWVKPEHQRALYRTSRRRRRGVRPGHFGARALHALRLEKSFGTWAREYRPIYTASEAGLDRFVALNKGDFIGCEAALREREGGGAYRLVSFEVDAADADAIRRRADPARRQDRRLGHLRRLRPHPRRLACDGLRSATRSPRRLDGFAIEIMGEDRRARRLERAGVRPGRAADALLIGAAGVAHDMANEKPR